MNKIKFSSVLVMLLIVSGVFQAAEAQVQSPDDTLMIVDEKRT